MFGLWSFSLSCFDSTLLCNRSFPLDRLPCNLTERSVVLKSRTVILELYSAWLDACSSTLEPCCRLGRFSLSSLKATVHELKLLSDLESFFPSSISDVTSGVSPVVLAEDRADITLSDTVVLLDVVLELLPISLANISSDKAVCGKSKYSLTGV